VCRLPILLTQGRGKRGEGRKGRRKKGKRLGFRWPPPLPRYLKRKRRKVQKRKRKEERTAPAGLRLGYPDPPHPARGG